MNINNIPYFILDPTDHAAICFEKNTRQLAVVNEDMSHLTKLAIACLAASAVFFYLASLVPAIGFLAAGLFFIYSSFTPNPNPTLDWCTALDAFENKDWKSATEAIEKRVVIQPPYTCISNEIGISAGDCEMMDRRNIELIVMIRSVYANLAIQSLFNQNTPDKKELLDHLNKAKSLQGDGKESVYRDLIIKIYNQFEQTNFEDPNSLQELRDFISNHPNPKYYVKLVHPQIQ